jgi:lipopolysaccharide export system protein LptC
MNARIETNEAKQLRSRRQGFAASGGSHDRLIGVLSRVLPMAVGVLAAFMVITPLSPRGEVSFLLDRNKVAMIDERLRVDNAMYRGKDDKGQPFSLTAGEAVQRSGVEGIVRMQDLIARILLPEGPARLTAAGGSYTIAEDVVAVNGPLRLTASDGYDMTASGVSINLRTKHLVGANGISGAVPAGTFSANRIDADLPARTITLDGNARIRMIPGKLRMP